MSTSVFLRRLVRSVSLCPGFANSVRNSEEVGGSKMSQLSKEMTDRTHSLRQNCTYRMLDDEFPPRNRPRQATACDSLVYDRLHVKSLWACSCHPCLCSPESIDPTYSADYVSTTQQRYKKWYTVLWQCCRSQVLELWQMTTHWWHSLFPVAVDSFSQQQTTLY